MSEMQHLNYCYRIELKTFEDIFEFFKITTTLSGKVLLRDSENICISAKSILGAMMFINWNELYCESEKDIHKEIEKFCV